MSISIFGKSAPRSLFLPEISSIRGMLLDLFRSHQAWRTPLRCAAQVMRPRHFSSAAIACPPHHIPKLSIALLPESILENLYGYFAIGADVAAIHARCVERHGDVAVLVDGDHTARPAQFAQLVHDDKVSRFR